MASRLNITVSFDTENISCMGGAAKTSFQEVCNYSNFTNTERTSSVWIMQ